MNPMSKFSDDFFFEILSWLPVSSLLRFRLVCKSWFILITQNSSFAKSQLLHHANSTQIVDNPTVLFTSRYHGTLYSLKYVDIASSSSLANVYENLVKHPGTLHSFKFVASCNGLICIKMYLKYEVILCLWNPSTCEFKELPAIPYKHPAQGYRVIAFGFGCNRSLDDYKVIRILQYIRNEENYLSKYDVWDDKEENLYFLVYTLGTNSWKVIQEEDMPCNVRWSEDSRGFHMNGGLHWIGSVTSTESNDAIISFDIEDEEFGEVPKPDCLDVMNNAGLQVLGGCLCIFSFDYENCLDVWMMKDYGVKESWTKLFTISSFLQEYYLDTLKALWLFKHGELLLIDLDKNLVLYDPKCETFKKIGPQLASNYGWFDTVIYIESLLSLKSGTYACQYITSSDQRKRHLKRKDNAEWSQCTMMGCANHIQMTFSPLVLIDSSFRASPKAYSIGHLLVCGR